MISESAARKIIHGSAIGHAVIDGAIPQVHFNSTVALTVETILMVTTIVKACGAN